MKDVGSKPGECFQQNLELAPVHGGQKETEERIRLVQIGR